MHDEPVVVLASERSSMYNYSGVGIDIVLLSGCSVASRFNRSASWHPYGPGERSRDVSHSRPSGHAFGLQITLYLLSFTMEASVFSYSSTSLAPTSVMSLRLPSKTMVGTLSTPFPACSRTKFFTSRRPSFLSSMKALASSSGIPASVVAFNSVSSVEGCLSCWKYCEYKAAHRMSYACMQASLALLELRLTENDLVGYLRAFLLLEMLDHPMCIHCISNGTTEFEIDAGTYSVCLHQGHVHLHLVF